MNFRTTITSFENLKKLQKIGIKEFVIGSKDFALRTTKTFELNEVLKIAKYTKENNLKLYVLITKLFRNNQLVNVLEYLKSLKDVTGVIIADPAIYQIIKKNNINLDFLIDQETIATNHYTTNFWLKLGAKEVTLARELTIEEINEICKNSSNITIQGHGFMYMFHSPRKLISNYEKEIKKDFLKTEILYDKSRDLSYPIIEDDSGTHIMSGFEQCSIDVMNKIIGVKTLFLNGYLLDEDYFLEVIKCYVNKENIENSILKEKIKNMSKNKIDYGFLFKPTVYKVKK